MLVSPCYFIDWILAGPLRLANSKFFGEFIASPANTKINGMPSRMLALSVRRIGIYSVGFALGAFIAK